MMRALSDDVMRLNSNIPFVVHSQCNIKLACFLLFSVHEEDPVGLKHCVENTNRSNHGPPFEFLH